jgi:hypothetical protein
MKIDVHITNNVTGETRVDCDCGHLEKYEDDFLQWYYEEGSLSDNFNRFLDFYRAGGQEAYDSNGRFHKYIGETYSVMIYERDTNRLIYQDSGEGV